VSSSPISEIIYSRKERIKNVEFLLMLAYFLLEIIGYLFVKSSVINSPLEGIENQQFMWIILGNILFILLIFIPERFIKKHIPLLFYITLLFLFLVLFFPAISGARRWIRIGPVGFQPSEIFKPVFILYLSYILSQKDSKKFYFASLMIILAALLIYKEPDFSSTIIILLTWFVLVFISGNFEKVWQYSLGLSLVAAPFIFFNLQEYQRGRIIGFLFPQEYSLSYYYNTAQAIRAVGSGGILGQGYMSGYMNLTGSVPESHTDFIFAVIGEELGFLGVCIVLLLYSTIIWRLYEGYKRSENLFWELFYVGTAFMIFFHVFQNIGMNLGILPVTGIPLPLISNGGTSFVSFSILLGIATKGLMTEKNITR
jgi:rod shape determining protein RodA